MFLKLKLKRTIKIFLAHSGMNKTRINYVLGQNIDRYVNSIALLKDSPFSHMSQQDCLERLLVETAEQYMVDLLDIEQGRIEREEDIIKLHFCIAIMSVVTADQWAPMCNQILRLDLWHKHWNKINEVGVNIVKQPVEVAPFINVLLNLIQTNYNSGQLQLEHGFPLNEMTEMMLLEHS
tara:strand:- start:2492 stop:3028 length:537 start_codon:yes stop_codon:yes gene_type:complete